MVAPAPSPEVVTFFGMCDASGAVPIDERHFLVADDEDNVLRVYDADRPGPPLSAVDVSPWLQLPEKKSNKAKRAPRPPETDIEAGTRLGEAAYWLTSHGRNSSGKLKPERLRLFATGMKVTDSKLEVLGSYDHLLTDLFADPRMARFGLAAAAEKAPKAEGGLNIEGMTGRPEGGVWIGFRSPLIEGRALLVPLLNPEQVILGQKSRFGEPLTLDLGGLGVRSLSSFRGSYLIAAGHTSEGGRARLFAWNGGARLAPLDLGAGRDLNPEGLFTPEQRDEVLLLSDDGSVELDGVACKRLKDPSLKRFRAAWLPLQQQLQAFRSSEAAP